ncbi:P-loop NTPase fold protein [Bradyrhizobium sp. LHD-71]|uniref:KAP family P-loop NTPase fold protein n=1 Tax=Bradyrhizobium sp. LHD-71 TaxID=3072141 RepID=UPI00280FDC57|nr:P-loop NTPase fold protein [Bradyrhizobium sp. LHD-71]MDQ8730679.1 P-loop NTPase fold protein [Bradyrhizobium sp. LHD-71]
MNTELKLKEMFAQKVVASPESANFNDKPITEPSADCFGLDPFAQALANAILGIRSPEGTVIALNGPWGSGKSSAVNLILHHLNGRVEAGEIGVVNFACWWFRGEEALTLAFFRELYAGLGPTLGERFTSVLPKLGARLMRAGSVVGPGIDAVGGLGLGSVAAGAMNWLSDLIPQEETIERLHADLIKALSEQTKRFLIVIDDIDRLAPDEALLIFRLVKSVGRLPNVVYLMVFDRQLADAIVAERYPSEGAHYLEKIIQAGFDIPEPRQGDLTRQLLEKIDALCGEPIDDDGVRFMNIVYGVIAPLVKTPRDLLRVMNALSVSWPAIGHELNTADFIAIETLRVLRPEIYRALRRTKKLLCGTGRDLTADAKSSESAEYDRELLGSIAEPQRPAMRRALRRIFPLLDSVWSNMHYSSDREWARGRQVCSETHFDSYFRFALGEEAVPRDEIGELINRAGDREFIKSKLRDALQEVRSDGTTRAALLLEELNLHADSVLEEHVSSVLAALFEIGDELDVESDSDKAFKLASNNVRIHWVLRRLILERFDLPSRSAMLVAACRSASLAWFVGLAEDAYRDYYPRPGNPPEREEQCLTTEADALELRKRSLERIRVAAAAGHLADNGQLPYLMYRWRDLAEDDGREVKEWATAQLSDDAMVVRFAKAFTFYSWSQSVGFSGLGDAVAKRNTRASVQSLGEVMDKERLRARVKELATTGGLPAADQQAVQEFLDAWKRHDENPGRA